MSFYVNDTSLEEITFNNENVKAVYYNNILVWGEPVFPSVDAMTWEDIYKMCKAKQNGEIDEWPEGIGLGTTFPITYSEEFLGETETEAMIIGLDIDGPGTITFQTKNCLVATLPDGKKDRVFHNVGDYSSPGTYPSVRYEYSLDDVCEKFYQITGLNEYIKPVLKGTCETYGTPDKAVTMTERKEIENNIQRNEPVVYKEYYVWIPSEFEMGLDKYAPISVANSTPTNAECTYGVCQPYPYYDNDEKRIKKYHNIDGSLSSSGTPYWTRSLSWWRWVQPLSSDLWKTAESATSVRHTGKSTNIYDGGASFFNSNVAPAFVIG
jgi:hypothetical protein